MSDETKDANPAAEPPRGSEHLRMSRSLQGKSSLSLNRMAVSVLKQTQAALAPLYAQTNVELYTNVQKYRRWRDRARILVFISSLCNIIVSAVSVYGWNESTSMGNATVILAIFTGIAIKIEDFCTNSYNAASEAFSNTAGGMLLGNVEKIPTDRHPPRERPAPSRTPPPESWDVVGPPLGSPAPRSQAEPQQVVVSVLPSQVPPQAPQVSQQVSPQEPPQAPQVPSQAPLMPLLLQQTMPLQAPQVLPLLVLPQALAQPPPSAPSQLLTPDARPRLLSVAPPAALPVLVSRSPPPEGPR